MEAHAEKEQSDTPTETTSFQFACRRGMSWQTIPGAEETSVRTIENLQGWRGREVMKDIQDKQSKGTEYIGTKPLRC